MDCSCFAAKSIVFHFHNWSEVNPTRSFQRSCQTSFMSLSGSVYWLVRGITYSPHDPERSRTPPSGRTKVGISWGPIGYYVAPHRDQNAEKPQIAVCFRRPRTSRGVNVEDSSGMWSGLAGVSTLANLGSERVRRSGGERDS